MKKFFLAVVVLFWGLNFCIAQQNKLLSLCRLGGGTQNLAFNKTIYTSDGGAIIRLQTSYSTNGNTTNCFTTPPSHYYALFQKLDSLGNVEWERKYAQVLDTSVLQIFPVGDGNFYTISRTGYNVVLSLENASQQRLWSAPAYGGADRLFFQSACRTDDGGFAIAFASDFAGGDVTVHYGSTLWSDIWILKLDSSGNKQWSRTVGGSGVDYPTKIIAAKNNGVYVVGFSDSWDYDVYDGNGYPDFYLAELDGSGSLIKSRCYGGSNDDRAYDVVLDNDKGLLIAGNTLSIDGDVSNSHGPDGSPDFWLVKVDSNGNMLWNNGYGGYKNSEGANALCKAKDGSIWLTGVCVRPGGQVYSTVDTLYGDSWTVRADSMGNFLSSKVLGTTRIDQGKIVLPLAGGVVMVVGEYDGNPTPGSEFTLQREGFRDIFFARLAPWTTSVEQTTAQQIKCKIYPNPADNMLTVELQENASKTYTVLLQNTGCGLLYSKTILGNEKLSIPISTYARGLYYISVTGKNNEHLIQKIIFQ